LGNQAGPRSQDGKSDGDSGTDNPQGDDFGDLIDDAPPPPDTPVIVENKRHDLERTWLLAVFLALFVITILADLAGSAWLPAAAWAQMKPEVQDVRTFMFQFVGLIIGFYFGTRQRRK
jgi:hypothetical protein